MSPNQTVSNGIRNGDRVKTLVKDLSLQEKKQLVSELLGTEELSDVWEEVFGKRIENYLEAEGNLYHIFSTLADRLGKTLASSELNSSEEMSLSL